MLQKSILIAHHIILRSGLPLMQRYKGSAAYRLVYVSALNPSKISHWC
jgi:hypothetical protein